VAAKGPKKVASKPKPKRSKKPKVLLKVEPRRRRLEAERSKATIVEEEEGQETDSELDEDNSDSLSESGTDSEHSNNAKQKDIESAKLKKEEEAFKKAVSKSFPKLPIHKKGYNISYKTLSVVDKVLEEIRRWHPDIFVRKVEPNLKFLEMRKEFLLKEEKNPTGKLLDPKFRLQPTPSLDVMFLDLPKSFRKDYEKYIFSKNSEEELMRLNKEYRKGIAKNFLGRQSDYVGENPSKYYSFGFDSKQRIGKDYPQN
jgi:hypothetical protein